MGEDEFLEMAYEDRQAPDVEDEFDSWDACPECGELECFDH